MDKQGKQEKRYFHLHCMIKQEIIDELDEICEETGLARTRAIERALIAYMKNYAETGKA